MEKHTQFAPIVLKLLQGPIYIDDHSYWSLLLNNQSLVHNYLEKIGLRLHLNEAEGFAYLSQPEQEEDEVKLPRLIRRKALSYEVTLLLVLLREALEEFDVNEVTMSSFFISKSQIIERAEVFLKEKSDRLKILKHIDKYIQQLQDLGFLKSIDESTAIANKPNQNIELRFEVKRIIKDKIDNRKLEEIKTKLQAYGESI